MQLISKEGMKNYFENYAINHDKPYKYLWCATNAAKHSHMDFYEFLIVTRGCLQHFYNGQQQTLYEKSVFLFKPGETHCISTDPFKSMHFTLLLKPEYFESFFEDRMELQKVFAEGANHAFCNLDDEEFTCIFNLVGFLIPGCDEDKLMSSLIHTLIITINRKNKCNDLSNKYIEDIVQKMNNNIYLTCKIKDIYEKYPVAQNILTREFKKRMGMSMIQYQIRQKLSYAAQMLCDSEYSISEIASILSFDSLSHFLRIFKNQYGITPKEYRNKHKKEDTV